MQPLRQLYRTFRPAALDLVYPPGCASCDEPVPEDACFCPLCEVTLESLERACPRCALPVLGACRACEAFPPPFDEAHAPYAFGGALADAIRLLKFSSRVDLGERLGELLGEAVSHYAEQLVDPLIVPVPLSRRRLAARGFNQAALIALGAARASTPICGGRSLHVRTDVLVRVRDTPSQVGQSAQARRMAMTNAFVATVPLGDRDIILVDDVMTTGATLAACAEAVRAAGASYVVALTVGRALP